MGDGCWEVNERREEIMAGYRRWAMGNGTDQRPKNGSRWGLTGMEGIRAGDGMESVLCINMAGFLGVITRLRNAFLASLRDSPKPRPDLHLFISRFCRERLWWGLQKETRA